MNHSKTQHLVFKLRQAVGSMAIEGIQVSRQSQAMMLKVAAGRLAGEEVRKQLVEKYRRS